MKYIGVLIAFFYLIGANTIYDFNQKSNIENWIIVDDVVMGGNSSGTFRLSPEGHGVFKGYVSLENNGGFSSVRYNFKKLPIENYSKIILKVKGDGKKYQFRIKSNSSDYYSYITTFNTSGKWQDIEISLKEMYPSFRGRRLDLPNFTDANIEEITFLIGNKIEEPFELLIDEISLK